MKRITEQLAEQQSPHEQDNKKKIRRGGVLSKSALAQENRQYQGTTAISEGCRKSGFVPAFYDTLSDRSAISCFADGTPAPVHLLDGVPVEWVSEYDAEGHVVSLRPGVIAGFLRDGRFYTREEVAQAG